MSARLSDHELRRLSEASLAESLRETARFTPGGAIYESADTLSTLSSTRFAPGIFNAAMCLADPPADPDAWLRERRAFYAQHQRGFTVYTRAHCDGSLAEACARAGMMRLGDTPGMVCDAPCPQPSLDARVTLEVATTLADLSDFAGIEAAAYATLGLPEQVTRGVFSHPARLLAPHWLIVIAHYEGRPAAAAMALLSNGIGGLYWVATVPELRGKGLGAAVTSRATQAAFEHGARAVLLEASPQGEPVYKRLGFREIARYPWFVQFA